MADDQASITKGFQDYQATAMSNDAKALWQKTQTGWQAYLDASQPFLQFSRANNREQAMVYLAADGEQAFNVAMSTAQDWLTLNNKLADQARQNGQNSYTLARSLTLGALVIVVLLAVALGLFLARSIAGAAGKMVQAAEQIGEVDLAALAATAAALAGGDLTQTVSVRAQTLAVRSNDEMGDLAWVFNQMIMRLQETGRAFTEMTGEPAQPCRADCGQRVASRQCQRAIGVSCPAIGRCHGASNERHPASRHRREQPGQQCQRGDRLHGSDRRAVWPRWLAMPRCRRIRLAGRATWSSGCMPRSRRRARPPISRRLPLSRW